jgi:hypothetical protein
VPTDTDTLAAQAEAEAQSMSLDDLRAHYAWNTAISERDEALARVAELEAQLVAARAAGRLSPTCRRCWRTRRATMKTEIPHVDPKTTTGLGWWWEGFDDHDRRFIIMRCPNGHDGTLRHVKNNTGHEIAADGTVHPSIVCPYEGCDFHEWGRLLGWDPR